MGDELFAQGRRWSRPARGPCEVRTPTTGADGWQPAPAWPSLLIGRQSKSMSHDDTQQAPRARRRDRLPHGWMMVMCVPMAVIVIALVATGVASAGLLLAAVVCVAMMAVMMRAVSGGGGGEQR